MLFCLNNHGIYPIDSASDNKNHFNHKYQRCLRVVFPVIDQPPTRQSVMNLNKENYKHSDLTDKIIKGFYTVYNELGHGFLEKVYENALYHELTENGLSVVKQRPIKVYYDDVEVGSYFADLWVEDLVIVELKAASQLNKISEVQLVNYLKATDIEVGLLFNFGDKAEIKRRVFSNSCSL